MNTIPNKLQGWPYPLDVKNLFYGMFICIQFLGATYVCDVKCKRKMEKKLNHFDNKPIRPSVRKLSLELQKTNSIWIEVEAFFVSTETVHLQQQCCLMQMKIESSLEAPLNTKKQTTIVMLRQRWKQWQTWQSPIFSQFINGRLTWKFSPQASNPTLMCERGPAEKI